jgi:hypothetical protein
VFVIALCDGLRHPFHLVHEAATAEHLCIQGHRGIEGEEPTGCLTGSIEIFREKGGDE